MADTNTTPKKKDRTLLYMAAGGIGLFVIGRYLGRRDSAEDFAAILSECAETNRVDTQLADTAAHASELSHQLYEISRRLREGAA